MTRSVFLKFAICLGLVPVCAAAQDMPLSQVLLDDAPWEVVSSGHTYTEGPAVDGSGNVYFSDVRESKIYKIDTAGKRTLFAQNTGNTNGLMFAPDARLFACRMGDRQIVAYHPDGQFDVLARDVDCNDLAVTQTGGVYFTDPKQQQVWFLNSAGEKRVVADGFKPNGCALWSDGGTLVVTDGNADCLWTFRVEDDGSLSFKDRYYSPLRILPDKPGPGSDGITLDADGRLYVATHAGIQMFDPTGRMGGVILNPRRKYLSNIVFGGPNREYLYATSVDKVFRRKMKSRGLPALMK